MFVGGMYTGSMLLSGSSGGGAAHSGGAETRVLPTIALRFASAGTAARSRFRACVPAAAAAVPAAIRLHGYDTVKTHVLYRYGRRNPPVSSWAEAVFLIPSWEQPVIGNLQ